MNKFFLIALILFTASSAFAGTNFIDNPSFDADPSCRGWYRCTRSACFYPYMEESRGNMIRDKFFAMAGPGNVSYKMSNIGLDTPLYAYAEVSFSDWGKSSYFEVKLELIENNKVIARKEMQITRPDFWHVIATDYPTYKKFNSTDVTLKISFKAENDGDFALNYAQVGTDSRNLGGRGPRDRR